MPINPSPIDAKVEIQLELCEEEDATLEDVTPVTDNQPPH